MEIIRSIKNVRSTNGAAQFEIHRLQSEAGQLTLFQNKYVILWIQDGKGEIKIDLDRFFIENNSLYFIKPGQALHITLDEPVSGYLVDFEREFLMLFEKGSNGLSHTLLSNLYQALPLIRIDPGMDMFLDSIAEKMLYEHANYHESRAEAISSFLRIFLIYLGRQCQLKKDEAGNDDRIANGFFGLLEKHYIDKRMVKDYADIMNITPGYLNKVIKCISGFPASYHIQQRIILEAKRRAIFNDSSLKEISYTLGFPDPSHFSKFFKVSSGINFTEFKKTALRYG
ncbi:helix-turn-helix domain-containing protein [Flavihumibacter solisilvae]|uniref:HTH araC/xylS-type domain-containing protein n=1 Tax=Flavihumibacter solisilvae TaxID=1349421 RepID=A0A0C1IEP3_9BACT|nr:helix-turn-helix domain-containing protein [Flavihumibacter solisilvae]KIC92630.1 hypothetical protein OI18_21865 [Flavihumibacter solisilvae]